VTLESSSPMFVAIDFETANSERGSACQIGYAIVSGNEVIESGSELCKPIDCNGPEDFHEFNVSIHGIDWDDVKNEPEFPDVWKKLSAKFHGVPLVAHNAGFDLYVLRDSLDETDLFELDPIDYTCTLVCSRRLLDLPSFGLPYVAEELGVNLENHHDAGADAVACAEIALELCKRNDAQTLDQLLTIAGVRWGRLEFGELRGSTAKQRRYERLAPSADASPDNYLFGKHICLTGWLPGGILRRDALTRIASLGGISQNAVNSKTEILVVGELDPQHIPDDAHLTSKMRKAIDLKSKGQNIEVISGFDFLSYLYGG
jgi:DNA polymerase III epsilon subunit-like protein